MLRIAHWDTIFENNRSREIARIGWVAWPNDLAADGYLRLVNSENGAAHLGCWTSIVMLASRTPRPYRGWLRRDSGAPHDAESISLATRLPRELVERVIDLCIEIGLIEQVKDKPVKSKALPSHLPAVSPQLDAASPHADAAELKRTELNGTEGTGAAAKRSEPIAAATIAHFRGFLELKHLGVLDDAMVVRIISALGPAPFEAFEERARKRTRQMGTTIQSYAFFELLASDTYEAFRRSQAAKGAAA